MNLFRQRAVGEGSSNRSATSMRRWSDDGTNKLRRFWFRSCFGTKSEANFTNYFRIRDREYKSNSEHLLIWFVRWEVYHKFENNLPVNSLRTRRAKFVNFSQSEPMLNSVCSHFPKNYRIRLPNLQRISLGVRIPKFASFCEFGAPCHMQATGWNPATNVL